MCGLVGELHRSLERGKSDKFVMTALDLLHNRGPNDSGTEFGDWYSLGHTRLAIKDSGNYISKQPMASNCSRYTLCFNGEIYNYREIRKLLVKKGYSFVTDTDSEVILKGFVAFGTEVFSMLDGMFAVAILDKVSQKLFLARDRFGIKPLFYRTVTDGIKFCSNASVLSEDRPILDEQSVLEYQMFRFPISKESYLSGIQQVNPGQYIEYSFDRISYNFYYESNVSSRASLISASQASDELYHLVNESIGSQTNGLTSYTSFLSGGVDSSILAHVLSANKGVDLRTFSIGFSDSNYCENIYAEESALHSGTTHQSLETIVDYPTALRTLIERKKDLSGVINDPFFFELAKRASDFGQVALSGEGLDELFFGYGRIYQIPGDFIMSQNLDKLSPSIRQKILSKYGVTNFNGHVEHFLRRYSILNIDRLSDFFSPDLNLSDSVDKVSETIDDVFKNSGSELYIDKIDSFMKKVKSSHYKFIALTAL